MKLWVTLFLCMLLGVPAVQANSVGKALSKWRNFRFTKASELSFSQRCEIVEQMQRRIADAKRLNRLNLPPAQLPAFSGTVRQYYKTVARNLPEVAVKLPGTASNTLEDLAMDLPLALKEENVFVQTIPGITPPTDVYMAALFADGWAGWLESGVVSAESVKKAQNAEAVAEGLKTETPAELIFPEGDIKRARQLERDLSAQFKELYNALPAEQKDLAVQLDKVLEEVRVQTGWPAEEIEVLRNYFTVLLKPMMKRSGKLTPVEFLQSYDVLAVAGELPARYQSRLRKGTSTYVPFMLNEAIGRVLNRLPESFGTSVRANFLRKWIANMYAPSKIFESAE